MKRKKGYNVTFGLCMLFGFIVIFRTTGLSDLNLIDFNTLLVRSCIGIVLMLIGYIGLKVTGWEHIL